MGPEKKVKNNSQLIPLLIFTALTIAVVFPLFKSGHMFLPDMTWPPVFDLADSLQNGIGPAFPLTLLIKLFSLFFSTALIQKIILSLLLFGSGYFTYHLARRFMPTAYATLAGMIYMVNPWVYERFLAGHWLVLLGYAVFPLIIRLFLNWRERLTVKSFIPLAILYSIYPILSPHWAYISTLFLLALFIISALARNSLPAIKPYLKWSNKKAVFNAFVPRPVASLALLLGFLCFFCSREFVLAT